jgi:hypothetical protein
VLLPLPYQYLTSSLCFGILGFNQVIEASEQIASVQERIRGVKENVGDFTSRLVKVEQ